jgi:hypothetical protein
MSLVDPSNPIFGYTNEPKRLDLEFCKGRKYRGKPENLQVQRRSKISPGSTERNPNR